MSIPQILRYTGLGLVFAINLMVIYRVGYNEIEFVSSLAFLNYLILSFATKEDEKKDR